MSNKSIALITGASSGIGEQFALQLAERCDEMILVARRAQRLEALAEKLAECGVKSHILAVDLTDPLGRGYVVEAIRQKGPVKWLVNNAGFGTLGKFAELGIAEQQAMVELHITATLTLSRAAIPFMQKAGGGVIINVSSLMSVAPYPGVAVYGASKAFLNNFSEALAGELAGDNIRVQCLCPGYTRTEFHQTEHFSRFDPARVPEDMWMDADAVVKESLTALAGDQVIVFAGQFNQDSARALLHASADRIK